MKLDRVAWSKSPQGETLATFGAARLARKLDGRCELSGGAPADHAEAREWCALFMPEVIRKVNAQPLPPVRPGLRS